MESEREARSYDMMAWHACLHATLAVIVDMSFLWKAPPLRKVIIFEWNMRIALSIAELPKLSIHDANFGDIYAKSQMHFGFMLLHCVCVVGISVSFVVKWSFVGIRCKCQKIAFSLRWLVSSQVSPNNPFHSFPVFCWQDGTWKVFCIRELQVVVSNHAALLHLCEHSTPNAKPFRDKMYLVSITDNHISAMISVSFETYIKYTESQSFGILKL